MSGHNKWSQIKERKGKTDAQKSKVFGKYAKLITVEAKKAGGNRNSPGLKAIIDRAKAENMPNDNIERAIKRATESKTALESITYEAYGPGGCAMIIEALTDNRTKQAKEVKFILSQHGYALAAQGSASWAFERHDTNTPIDANNTNNYEKFKPTTTVPLSDEDLSALEKLVDALEANDEVQAVYTNAE